MVADPARGEMIIRQKYTTLQLFYTACNKRENVRTQETTINASELGSAKQLSLSNTWIRKGPFTVSSTNAANLASGNLYAIIDVLFGFSRDDLVPPLRPIRIIPSVLVMLPAAIAQYHGRGAGSWSAIVNMHIDCDSTSLFMHMQRGAYTLDEVIYLWDI